MTLILGLLIIAKSRKFCNVLFLIFAFITAWWILTNYLISIFPTIFFLKSSYAAGFLVAPSALVFILAFIKGKIALKKIFVLYITSIILFLLTYFDGLIIKKADSIFLGGFEGEFGPLFPVFSIYSILLVLFTLSKLFIETKKAQGVKRLQLQYFSLGMFLFGSIASLCSFILPMLGINRLISLDSSSSLFFIIFTAYSITRYRLFDIRIIIRKSLIYSILFAILIGLAAFSITLLSKYISSTFNTTFIFGAALISVALALLFYPAKHLIQKIINKIVFSKTPVYEDQVVLLKQTLQNGKEFKKLCTKVENIIRTTLKTEEIFVAVKNPSQSSLEEHFSRNLICSPIALDHPLIRHLAEKRTLLVKEEIPYLIDENKRQKDVLNLADKFLNKARAEIAVPLFCDEKIIGLLLLGKKQNNESYSANDLEFLETFQKDFSYALSNTLLYESALARAKQSA